MSAVPMHDVIIIGTGFGGLGMAIQLQEAGINNVLVLEKAADVGGVWRDNRYPGAACDVPSHLYSYSFAPNARWSRKFAQQPEIHQYLRECAEQYGLRKLIRFNTEVVAASFSAEQGLWTLTTANGEQLQARAVVSAVGQLNRPAIPRIDGIEQFQGQVMHSAQWNDDVVLEGKRIAVIGTGASAIQFVPKIVPKAKSLVLVQRSAPYVIPKPDRAYLAAEKVIFERLPKFQLGSRLWQYLGHERNALAFTVWDKLMALPAWQFRSNLNKHIKDPELRAKLTPDYPMGCKRILISNDYYPALAQQHVTVTTHGVTHADATGVVTADGVHHEVDVIIYGTGFKATEFLSPMKITGLQGQDLHARWQGGAEAYLGLTVSGFPNFFMMYGPNTNLGHNSIVYMLESQMNYIRQCVQKLQKEQLKYLDVKSAPMDAFNQDLQAHLHKTVWDGGCKSWYVNESGKNTANWSGFTLDYRLRTSKPNWSHYTVAK